MKIFPSLRRFARSIEEKGRTSRNGIVLALRQHFWSRVGHHLPVTNGSYKEPNSERRLQEARWNDTDLTEWRIAPRATVLTPEYLSERASLAAQNRRICSSITS